MRLAMRLLRNWNWALRLAAIVAVIGSIYLVGASYSGIWTTRDYAIYQAMGYECHPVWKDLYWGKIRKGESLDSVLEAHPPVKIEHFGDFVALQYHPDRSFTGIEIIAKEGRVLSARAGSCTWACKFFDGMTKEQWEHYWDARSWHYAAAMSAD
jgi:hypothetical protein